MITKYSFFLKGGCVFLPYCDDPDDPEAAHQRPAARRLFEQAPALFVPLTVMLELEWVMRGFYRLSRHDFAQVVRLAGWHAPLAGLVVLEMRTR